MSFWTERYRAQWNVQAFREAIDGRAVHVIWDDHDFAWNNARGGGTAGGKDYVPAEYRRLARLHFETFRKTLSLQPATYPANPAPDGHAPNDLGTIAYTVALADGINMHLVDTRTYREEEGGQMLGPTQRTKLEEALLLEPDINVIASSSTLKDWKEYTDYSWLTDIAKRRRVLVLSGDVHEPDFRARGHLYEATASAMAQPPGPTSILGKKTGVYGVLTINPNEIEIQIFHGSKVAEEATINRNDWSVEN